MKNNRLIKGDNMVVMDEMIKNGEKVDLILTDPPYNVSRKHQLGFSNMGRKGMDFGHWDYNFDQLSWLEKAIKLLSKNGSILIFNDWKNMGMIASFLEEKGFSIKDLIKWEKTNPMPKNTNRRYVTDYEYIIWATPPKSKWVFNKPSSKPYLRPSFKTSIMAGGKNKIHPTQKPVTLLEKLIKVHSNKGDLIFDPFSGSGSTGAAAENSSRNFLLIEKEVNFYEEQKKRLRKISTTL